MPSSKIVQIAVTPSVAVQSEVDGYSMVDYETVYALRDDGRVFYYAFDIGPRWREIPPIPED